MIKFKWETKFKKTEIGEIPRDWEINEIGEVITQIEKGKVPEKFPGIYPYLSVDYLRGNLNNTEFYDKKAGVFVTKDDILIIWDGVINAGEIFRGREGLLSSTMCRLEYDKVKIEREYFYHALKLLEPIIREARRGTDDRHVDKNMFLGLKIPYPPPEEQSRIATVLSWFDDLIENKKRQNEILEKVAMAIFKSWFVDFEPFKDEEFVYSEELGKEIPEGWEVRKIREFIKIESGGSAPQGEKYFTNGEYPFVRVKHLSNQPCINGCDFINDDAVRHYKLKLFKEGSIIFQKSGESLSFARVNILPFDCYVVNHLAIVDSAMNKRIGFIYCLFKNLLSEIIEEQIGTALPYMKISDIQEKIILIPSQPILQHFHSLVEPLFQKIILNQKQIMVLRKIRDALLPKLVFGKLRVMEI